MVQFILFQLRPIILQSLSSPWSLWSQYAHLPPPHTHSALLSYIYIYLFISVSPIPPTLLYMHLYVYYISAFSLHHHIITYTSIHFIYMYFLDFFHIRENVIFVSLSLNYFV